MVFPHTCLIRFHFKYISNLYFVFIAHLLLLILRFRIIYLLSTISVLGSQIIRLNEYVKSHFCRKNIIILSLCTQRCYGRHNVSENL